MNVNISIVFTLFDIVESAKRLTKLMKIQKMMGFKVRLCQKCAIYRYELILLNNIPQASSQKF